MPSVAHWADAPQGGAFRPLSGAVSSVSGSPGGFVPGSLPVAALPGGPSSGLVFRSVTKAPEKTPSSIFSGVLSRSEFAERCRLRRLRRTRAAVLAKSSSVRASAPAGFRWTGAFITLTYREVADWRPDHVRLFMKSASAFARRRGVRLRYVWVAETQRRGAVHYHLVVWWSSRHGRAFRLPKPDSCGWWPHGLSNIRRLSACTGGEAYLAKYVSKGDDGALPRGLRLYGMDRDAVDSLAVHRACLPRWLALATGAGRVDRVSFLGWVSRVSGEVFRSRLRLVRERVAGVVVWRFVPAIERPALCLDCVFSVMTGREAGRRLSV